MKKKTKKVRKYKYRKMICINLDLQNLKVGNLLEDNNYLVKMKSKITLMGFLRLNQQ